MLCADLYIRVENTPRNKGGKRNDKPVQLDEKGHPKFGMIDKIAYAAGDFGCNMSFGLKGTVQTFWLTYMMLETLTKMNDELNQRRGK